MSDHSRTAAQAADPAYDLFSAAFRADPYATYARIRRESPVHWNEALQGWYLTRFGDVDLALHDRRFSPGGGVASLFEKLPDEAKEELEPLRLHLATWMGSLDPPDHTRIRGLMSRAFTPAVVEGLRPFIVRTVDDILDHHEAGGGMELVSDFAVPLPLTVIAHMLGTPPEDQHLFAQWSLAISALIGSGGGDVGIARGAQESIRQMTGHLERLIARRRGEPARGDLISGFLEAEADGESIAPDELLANCVMLLFAGHGTITVMIEVCVLFLLQHREVFETLRREPSLTPVAIEEMLRFDSPCQLIRRTATEDLELGGRRIRKGDLLWLNLGAACRDPERYENPDRFDLGRPNVRNLAFGAGIHYCLGAALSRLETEVAINRLLARFPELRIATDEIEWHPDPTARALTALPVSFTGSN